MEVCYNQNKSDGNREEVNTVMQEHYDLSTGCPTLWTAGEGSRGFRNQQVKLIRAQGGCLGTKSRRKT